MAVKKKKFINRHIEKELRQHILHNMLLPMQNPSSHFKGQYNIFLWFHLYLLSGWHGVLFRFLGSGTSAETRSGLGVLGPHKYFFFSKDNGPMAIVYGLQTRLVLCSFYEYVFICGIFKKEIECYIANNVRVPFLREALRQWCTQMCCRRC